MSNQKGTNSNAKDCDYKSKDEENTKNNHTMNFSDNVKNQKRIATGLQDDTERRDGPGGN